MTALFALVPFSIILFTGVIAFLAINRRGNVHIFELAAMAWLLGSAIIWLEVALLAMVGDKMSVTSLIIIGLAVAGALHCPQWPKLKITYAFHPLMLVPLALCAYSFFLAVYSPYIFADAQYYIKWVFLFLDGVGTPIINGRPQLISGLMAYVFKFTGIDTPSPIFMFPLFYSSLILLFYAALDREANAKQAALFTFLLAGFPLIFFHSTAIYCDLALTAYFFAAAMSMFLWLRTKQISEFIFLAIFGSAVFFTKQAGFAILMMLVVVAATSTIIRRMSWNK